VLLVSTVATSYPGSFRVGFTPSIDPLAGLQDWAPLHLAAHRGCPGTMALLLLHPHVDVNAQTTVCQFYCVPVVERLYSTARVRRNRAGGRGETPRIDIMVKATIPTHVRMDFEIAVIYLALRFPPVSMRLPEWTDAAGSCKYTD
jgi:hypothetical protein